MCNKLNHRAEKLKNIFLFSVNMLTGIYLVAGSAGFPFLGVDRVVSTPTAALV